MSFSRLNYDSCTYEHNLKQSVGAADYYLGAPRVDCRACFPYDPMVNLGFKHPGPVKEGPGASFCEDRTLTDVSSELYGITRKSTNCPSQQYLPADSHYCKNSKVEDCGVVPNEQTRLSNPPCTLRGTGWNRWEWLCTDPQAKALMAFDYNISNRLVVKDNHRPCLPKPINQAIALPPANASDDVYVAPPPCPQQPVFDPPSIHYRACSSVTSYA